MRTAPHSSPPSLRSTVFRSGNSQAVRIPKEFQFSTKHVTVTREGNALLIQPRPMSAADVLADLPPLPAAEAQALDSAIRQRADDLPPLAERDLGFAPAETSPPLRRSARPAKTA